MTEKEKRTILDMRAAGKQYNEISAELGIEVTALKVASGRFTALSPSSVVTVSWNVTVVFVVARLGVVPAAKATLLSVSIITAAVTKAPIFLSFIMFLLSR